MCISETCLDSSVSLDDKDIAVEGYNILHADHPRNHKKDGVSIYYNESLAVQLININYLNKYLLLLLLLLLLLIYFKLTKLQKSLQK